MTPVAESLPEKVRAGAGVVGPGCNECQVVELSKDFSISELERDFADANPYFQRSVVVAEYAEILKKSYWAEGSSLAHVYHEAERISELLPPNQEMGEFMELIRRAYRLTD